MELDLRKANELFHDLESERYDDKWGIIYDAESVERVTRKFARLTNGDFPAAAKTLEVGCGTGYVGLNLCLAGGIVGEYHASDISQGMLDACSRKAGELGVPVATSRCGLEELTFPDNTFDLVIGHAVLHHIPDVDRALSEIFRVLKPGGRMMIAGEPTVAGDLMGRFARCVTRNAVRGYTRAGGSFGGSKAKLREHPVADGENEAEGYEHIVDIHTFNPYRVCRQTRSAGFSEVRFEGEEFLSSFVGWMTRTVENTFSEENISWNWRVRAYNIYRRLSAADERLYRFVPAALCYNMLLFGRKPGGNG